MSLAGVVLSRVLCRIMTAMLMPTIMAPMRSTTATSPAVDALVVVARAGIGREATKPRRLMMMMPTRRMLAAVGRDGRETRDARSVCICRVWMPKLLAGRECPSNSGCVACGARTWVGFQAIDVCTRT
jgi:hypothetical protein